MLRPEVLTALRQLMQLVPVLDTFQIRYTQTALLINTKAPGGNEGLGCFSFLSIVVCLNVLFIVILHKLWYGLIPSAGFMAAGAYGLRFVNRRVANRPNLPANFIVDTISRRITLPPLQKGSESLEIGFDEVTDIKAVLVSKTGYYEDAQLYFSLRQQPPQPVLALSSFAVAQQLARVLILIMHPRANFESVYRV